MEPGALGGVLERSWRGIGWILGALAVFLGCLKDSRGGPKLSFEGAGSDVKGKLCLSKKTIANKIPGIIAAINKSPMDCSVSIPYKIRSKLGGINIPRTEDPATTPTENLGE